MRGPLFWAYARARPRLEAEAALARINEGAIAAGQMEKNAKQRYFADLDKRIHGEVKAIRPSREQLAAMGVAVVRDDGSGGEVAA